MKVLIALIPTIMLAVYGQFITKWRVGAVMEKIGDVGPWERLFAYITDPFIISAYVFTFGASVVWMFVVERFALSLIYPIYIGLTILIVTIGGVIMFGETMTWSKAIAVVLILAGVMIAANA